MAMPTLMPGALFRRVRGDVSVSTTAKTGDAALTLAVVLAAVVGLTMTIAGLARGRERNHKK